MDKVAGPQLAHASGELPEECTHGHLWDALVLADVLCKVPARTVLHHQVYAIPLLQAIKNGITRKALKLVVT